LFHLCCSSLRLLALGASNEGRLLDLAAATAPDTWITGQPSIAIYVQRQFTTFNTRSACRRSLVLGAGGDGRLRLLDVAATLRRRPLRLVNNICAGNATSTARDEPLSSEFLVRYVNENRLLMNSIV